MTSPTVKSPAEEEPAAPKKKTSTGRRPPQVEKKPVEEAAPFAEIKLRKSSTVKREWETQELEQVNLKHHKPEDQPLDEAVRRYFQLPGLFPTFYCCSWNWAQTSA